jgi:iron(III) transport system ATP-binding protein
LAAAGTTTVLVTHDQSEALSLASTVAVMRDGRIVQAAPPAQLYRHPVDRDTAAFLGDVVALPGVATGGRAECALGTVGLHTNAADGPGTVLVRPEQITLDGAATDVRAEVLAIEYFGHDGLVRLALADGPPVLARCPAHRLPLVGTHVRIAVAGEAGFDPDRGASPQ